MKYDYLRWDAQSIQELLRRKLLESGILTDQLYPASDVKILIDLFAWTFDVLTYILNNSAADVLFNDTQLYENMNRIVKLLSYSPHGYLTCSSPFMIKLNTNQDFDADICTIPKFASIDTGKTDKYGNPIKYSFVEDFTFTKYNSSIVTPVTWPVLYNGEFKQFDVVFVASSIPYETFTMSGINPNDEDNPKYVDHNHFHIYIESIDEKNGKIIYTEWKQVRNLVLDGTYNDKIFELRLNENKEYTIKFGDNIHGAQLNRGDKIHIIYLQSNGEEGKIDTGEVSENVLSLDVDGFSGTDQLIDMCFEGFENFKRTYSSLFLLNGLVIQTCNKLVLTNINESTLPQGYEDVDSIRENAPNMFRLGNRLVTEGDYTTYILNNYKDRIHDIYVCNNTTYTTNFFQWLNIYGKLNIDIRKYYYRFADACDFNNIYLWMKPTYEGQITDSDLNIIVDDCNKIKSATSELVPCSAIETYFIPYVEHPEYPLKILETQLDADWNPPIKIILNKKTNTYINNEQLKEMVNNIFIDYFSLENQKLGNMVNISEIYKKIIETGYVESVQTENIPEENPNNVWVEDGLSFACYTPLIINGQDFEVFKFSKKLQPFQFAKLYSKTLLNLIEVRNEGTYNITNTGF